MLDDLEFRKRVITVLDFLMSQADATNIRDYMMRRDAITAIFELTEDINEEEARRDDD